MGRGTQASIPGLSRTFQDSWHPSRCNRNERAKRVHIIFMVCTSPARRYNIHFMPVHARYIPKNIVSDKRKADARDTHCLNSKEFLHFTTATTIDKPFTLLRTGVIKVSREVGFTSMTIQYRTAKFKSANVFISAALDYTAKFKDRQYFRLYGSRHEKNGFQHGPTGIL